MPDSHIPHSTAELDPKQAAQQLLALIEQLASEANQGTSALPEIQLDSQLDSDLGFDSLIRAELIQRTEVCFAVPLSDQALATIETPRDLLNEVFSALQAPSAVKANIGEIHLEKAEKAPEQVETLQELLDWHVQHHPDRPHLYVYQNADDVEIISYQVLHERARKIAQGLLAAGIEPGHTVAIMLPTCNEYFFCFYGILYARAIPVPIYPPARPSQLEDHLMRHAKILQNADARMLITVNEAKPLSQLLRMQATSIEHIVTPDEIAPDQDYVHVGQAKADDIAFLQYTSGSTGTPKGVTLTHRNLLTNVRAMGKAVGATPDDVFISWLPVYHDMGLIGAWFGSLYHAIPLVIMSPLLFLAKPQRWLWAIHHHKGTLSAAPNFAYELCVNKIDERDLQGLDLSSLRRAWNGAEPISADTMARFTERFAQYGFRPEAMAPVYGLAESTVGLTFPMQPRAPRVEYIDRDTFFRTGQAITATSSKPEKPQHQPDSASRTSPPPPPDHAFADSLPLIGLGHPLPGHQIRIVDSQGRELPERQEGELEFKGPSSTQGYYRSPEKTQELYHQDWLRTGDRGLTIDGELFLTGRCKDIIIKAGRNIYPHELEAAVSQLPGVRKGCVAAFAHTNTRNGTEQLIVLAETNLRTEEDKTALRNRIQAAAQEVLGIPVDDIALCPPHTVPKTSSGKIRRSSCRHLYDTGTLNAPQRAVWWQTLRVAVAGMQPTLNQFVRQAKSYLFAGYMWLILGLLAPPVWLLVALLPSHLAWRVTRWGARTLLWLTATPFTVQGKSHLPPKGTPGILVVNHASYLDGIMVIAATDRELQFVAKSELLGNIFARIFLEKLGTHFVERFDTEKSLSDSQKLAEASMRPSPLTIFPEGTLYRMAGLHDFHLGAFQIAVDKQLPVIPVTLRGTRSMLRDQSLFPRRSAIDVIIGQPIYPNGEDWHAVLTLRNRARAEILAQCGEPDLAHETTR